MIQGLSLEPRPVPLGKARRCASLRCTSLGGVHLGGEHSGGVHRCQCTTPGRPGAEGEPQLLPASGVPNDLRSAELKMRALCLRC